MSLTNQTVNTFDFEYITLHTSSIKCCLCFSFVLYGTRVKRWYCCRYKFMFSLFYCFFAINDIMFCLICIQQLHQCKLQNCSLIIHELILLLSIEIYFNNDYKWKYLYNCYQGSGSSDNIHFSLDWCITDADYFCQIIFCSTLCYTFSNAQPIIICFNDWLF